MEQLSPRLWEKQAPLLKLMLSKALNSSQVTVRNTYWLINFLVWQTAFEIPRSIDKVCVREWQVEENHKLHFQRTGLHLLLCYSISAPPSRCSLSRCHGGAGGPARCEPSRGRKQHINHICFNPLYPKQCLPKWPCLRREICGMTMEGNSPMIRLHQTGY